MNLIQESFQRLFPNQEFLYRPAMEYNRRLSNFNANVRLQGNKLSVNLNLQWKDIDDEIKIGLIQHLLLKLFKQGGNTTNLELYNNFIKNIPILTVKNKSDPVLEAAFHRVNERFFSNSLDKPNLQWGQKACRKLASYNFHDDGVTVSTIFTESRPEVLDYLMYHELLHKYHKFKQKNGRSSFHTKEFRQAEALYPHQQEIEKEIELIIKQNKKKLSSKARFWDYIKKI